MKRDAPEHFVPATVQFDVRPVFNRGVALDTEERKKLPFFRGELLVREERVYALGRAATTARLRSLRDDQKGPLLAPLRDAHLLWVKDRDMRITGIETVDGIDYGQTWEIQVVVC